MASNQNVEEITSRVLIALTASSFVIVVVIVCLEYWGGLGHVSNHYVPIIGAVATLGSVVAALWIAVGNWNRQVKLHRMATGPQIEVRPLGRNGGVRLQCENFGETAAEVENFKVYAPATGTEPVTVYGPTVLILPGEWRPFVILEQERLQAVEDIRVKFEVRRLDLDEVDEVERTISSDVRVSRTKEEPDPQSK